MQALTPKQKKALKGQAYPLKPVVIIGDKGLTENVIKETDSALLAHELIKVRINAADRDALAATAAKLSQACQANLIQIIGHIAVIYRESAEK